MIQINWACSLTIQAYFLLGAFPSKIREVRLLASPCLFACCLQPRWGILRNDLTQSYRRQIPRLQKLH
jgi:hypothetical protein